MNELKAPFPWFGGKSRVADVVWQRFGDTPNYVEPFAGSLAVLLGRPHIGKVETVNDLDGFIANFWRAIKHDPEATARYADNPVNEVDLHARHAWLVTQRDGLVARLMGDLEFYDAKIAGWWCWGLCSWIGSGWCSGKGPWQSVDGIFQKVSNAGRGVNRKLPHLGNAGQGVNRQLPHLGNAGQGVNRQTGNGDRSAFILDWMMKLQTRLRNVRVACGDWERVCTRTVVERGTGTASDVCAVFLDPPYPTHDRAETYTHDCGQVAYAVRDWAIANGDNQQYRIALCGYDGHWDMPDSWSAHAWSTVGGYGSQGNGTRAATNRHRERIWFSPHCLPVDVAPDNMTLAGVA